MKYIPNEFESGFWAMVETYIELGYPEIEAHEIAEEWLDEKIHAE